MNNRHAGLDQDILTGIASNDPRALGKLVEAILTEVNHLKDLLRSRYFSLEKILELINEINAKTAIIPNNDNFKKQRAYIRTQLTTDIISAVAYAAYARNEYKNYEQLRDGLSAIIDKQTGLAILQGGVFMKTSMKKLEAIREDLNKSINERDKNLVTLIHAEKSNEVKAAIKAGAKVDWAIFFKGSADVDKGPLKVFLDLLKEDIQDLVGQLYRPEVCSLIDVVNQKTKYFSREPRFGSVREAITVFFKRKMSDILNVQPWKHNNPRQHLIGFNAVSESLDLVRWDVSDLIKLSLTHVLENFQFFLNDSVKQLNLRLMWAVGWGHVREIENLLTFGAEIDYVDLNTLNETPLSKAILSGDRELVRFLLERGASLVRVGPHFNWDIIKEKVTERWSSLIHDELIKDLCRDLRKMLTEGVNLRLIDIIQRKHDFLKTYNDQPVLPPAAFSPSDFVELFIQHRDAVPPLDSELLLKFQQLLIGLGVDAEKIGLKEPGPVVDPDVPDAEGYTPLMNAARFGRVNEAKALLNAGVTIDWLAFLWKLRQDYGLLSMYQRANVYPLLTLLSFNDIDALVGSSGAEDTDHLIEKLNNQTTPMYDPGYDNRFRRGWIRNKLVTVFKEKNELDSNPGLSKVLDKVLANLLIIQGKGSVNGMKKSMHALQLLRIKIASQNQMEVVVEDKPEDMPTMPPLMSGSSFDDFAEVTSLTDVSDDKARAASRSIREAIMRRDLDNLKLLIDEHPECIDRPGVDGLPPLLAAALENKGYYVIDMTDEILPYLIQRGAKIDWVAFSAVEPAMFNSFRQNIIYFLSSVVHGEIKELFKFESEDAVQALIKRINEKTQHLDIDVGSIARANIRTNFIFQLHQKKQEVMVSKDVSFLTATLKNLDYIAREMHIIQRTARDGKKDKHAMRELKLFINTTRAAISELNFQALLHLTNAEAIKTKINAINEEISSLDTLNIKSLREEISPSFIDILKKRRADFSNVIAEPVLQSAYDCFNQVLNGLVIIQSSDDRVMNAVRKNLNSLIEHLKGRLDKLAGVDKLPAGHRPTVFRDATAQEMEDREDQCYTGLESLENIHVVNDTNIFRL